ncbi:MAG: hypothetical protein GEV11_26450 [Streptosporangiales bacterium]|nr:hypothetical protein [Streptosporangiales bacterium]
MTRRRSSVRSGPEAVRSKAKARKGAARAAEPDGESTESTESFEAVREGDEPAATGDDGAFSGDLLAGPAAPNGVSYDGTDHAIADDAATEAETAYEPGNGVEADGLEAADLTETSFADPDDDYDPFPITRWPRHAQRMDRQELTRRVSALAELVDIGDGDFDADVVGSARHVLNRADARLRLSGEYTVVALAGGTGSGKSSLFNAVCGLDFSAVGVTRPTTSVTHACVWGEAEASELLSWFGVPRRFQHARASALDEGDARLNGLILLDLPDHDSVRIEHALESDRFIGAVDLLIWVLDPQKYADAVVHHRYLSEMAGHGAVTVIVLNQVDRLESQEIEECLNDLRRLLDSDELVQPHMMTTSAATGQGVDELKDLLVEVVTDRRAMAERLAADVGRIARGFERYVVPEADVERVPEEQVDALAAAFTEAAGTSAIGDSFEEAYAQRATRSVGWPFARFASRLRHDPLRRLRLPQVREALDAAFGGPVGAQQSDVDAALQRAADVVSEGLPAPWPARMRERVRDGSDALPKLIGDAVEAAVPEHEKAPVWWRLVRLWQYVLVAAVAAGVTWTAALAIFGLGGLEGAPSRVFDDPSLLPYAVGLTAGVLLLGWLTARGCHDLVLAAAARERDELDEQVASRIAEIAREHVVTRLEQELADYHRCERALRVCTAD